MNIADIVWQKVDRYALDEECVKQVELMVDYTVQSADARLAVDNLKTELDRLKGSVECDIRADPDKYNLLKVTEPTIAATLATQSRVLDAQKALAKARHQAALLDGLVTCLEARKKMLESLVFLHGQGYFSQVKPAAEPKEASRPAGTRKKK